METQLGRTLDVLKKEYRDKSSHLDALGGFIRFLLMELKENDPFWSELEHLLQLRQQGEISSYQAQTTLRSSVLQKFTEFITHIATAAAGGNTMVN